MTSKPRTVRLTDDEVALLQRAHELTTKGAAEGERRADGWTAALRKAGLAWARRVVDAAERKAGR